MRAFHAIVTHDKAAHQDEMLAVCLALAHPRGNARATVHRRQATPGDLASADVLVIDTGGKLQPELNNFDHHQMNRLGEPVCAYTLIARELDVERILKYNLWYTAQAEIDHLGTRAAAASRGLTVFPHWTSSPIAQGLLGMFSRTSSCKPGDLMHAVLRSIGDAVLASSADLAHGAELVEGLAEYVECKGHRGVFFPEGRGDGRMNDADYNVIAAWRATVRPDIEFTITPDRSGDGWRLFRFGDVEGIDMFKIRNRKDVPILSPRGDIAITRGPREGIGDKEWLLELLEQAMGKQR